MPTSKKRKPKPSSQSLQKLTAAIVPTRRQREAYKATCPPETRTAQLAEARAIIGKEVFNERKNARIARAYRALALSPLCVDAYVALYAEGGYSDEGVDYLKRGIHAGELALQGLHPNEDAFWQHSEGQPYLKARVDLAVHTVESDEDATITGLQAVLAFDPTDRIKARYALLDVLLNQDDVQPARNLLDKFPDDRSVEWLYGRLLVGYREEQRAGRAVEALMAEALAANPHVPSYLAELEGEADIGSDEPGTPGEADLYVSIAADRWDAEPGAIDWLVALARSVQDTPP